MSFTRIVFSFDSQIIVDKFSCCWGSVRKWLTSQTSDTERREDLELAHNLSCSSLEKSGNILWRVVHNQILSCFPLSCEAALAMDSVIERVRDGMRSHCTVLCSEAVLPFLSSLVKADWSLNNECLFGPEIMHNPALGLADDPGIHTSHWLQSGIIRSIVLNLFNLGVFISYQS